METNNECIETMKTPRRTRRTSLKESVSHHKSLVIGLPEIAENEGASSSIADPITPGRSKRTLDFQTPGRSEAISGAQTPRRSCRKSIKPIQEYENIVAQKGLTAKRLTADFLVVDEVKEVEVVSEKKWEQAVIGRASTKRGKKAKRNKNKRLQRQKKVTEDEVVEQASKSDEEMDNNGLNCKNDDITVGLLPGMSSEESILPDDNNEKEVEVETLSKEVPTGDIQIDEKIAELYEGSMDGGDVVMNAMPITADDCLQSTGKQTELFPTIQQTATPNLESTNKSDDSDCIMLSMNDSSQQEQSRQSNCPTPAAIDELKGETNNESSDSIVVNMPPLLLCSDDEEEDEEFVDALKSPHDDNVRTTESPQREKDLLEIDEPKCLNVTFDSCDKEEDNLDSEEIKRGEKPTLTIENEPVSPLDETFDANQSPPKIISVATPKISALATLNTATEATPRKTSLATPKSSTFATPKSLALATPRSPLPRPSIARLPTPFKTNKAIIPDILIEPDDEVEDTPEVIVVEPTDINLKSSRKRSFSFCVDRPKKNVTFHSPSNTTVNIYSGDLSKSVSKHNPTNITKRRKRSLSVTETEREIMDYIQLKKPSTPGTTPQKKLLQNSRIKMPNFSNIHQKQFQRMESISDHVARRAERAKNLINSNTKVRPASVQKGLPVKNSVLKDHNKDGKKANLAMPKARQRIDLSGQVIEATKSLNVATKYRSKSKQDLTMLDDGVRKIQTKPNSFNKLPKPTLNFNFNSSQNVTFNAAPTTNTAAPTMKTTLPSCWNTTIGALPKPNRIHLPNPREHFNLSQAVTPISHVNRADKLEDRRKRLMDMFKARSTQRGGESNREILKGVRTNRRFELQMMCRNRQK